MDFKCIKLAPIEISLEYLLPGLLTISRIAFGLSRANVGIMDFKTAKFLSSNDKRVSPSLCRTPAQMIIIFEFAVNA